MRHSKKRDLLRIREIFTILVKPWDDSDVEQLTNETKLWYALQPEEYPIYRRKIMRPMRVHGLWWMNESQWVRFLWQGHNAKILKSGQDPDRVLAIRAFEPGGWCYIRECGDQVDIEAMSRTTGWDPVKKKKKGTMREWLTVSCTKEEYKKLDSFLGPINDGCKHEEGKYDYLVE